MHEARTNAGNEDEMEENVRSGAAIEIKLARMRADSQRND